jgi:hypothetical protein
LKAALAVRNQSDRSDEILHERAGMAKVHDGSIIHRDATVIEEGGPVGSGQIRAIVSTKAFRDGDAMLLASGVFQAVGASRPLANNPSRYATTVIHVA